MLILLTLATIWAAPTPTLAYARLGEEIIEFVRATPGESPLAPYAKWEFPENREPLAVALTHDAEVAYVAWFGPQEAVRIERKRLPNGAPTRVCRGGLEDVLGLDVSPDGARLAVGAVRDGKLRLTLMGLPGGQETTLGPEGHGSNPSFSPDGSQVAYEAIVADDRGRGEQSTLWTVSIQGGVPRRLTPFGLRAFRPGWSPNGERIAYVASGGSFGLEAEVRTIGADGRAPERALRALPGGQLGSPFFAASGDEVWTWLDGDGFIAAASGGGTLVRKIEETAPVFVARWIR